MIAHLSPFMTNSQCRTFDSVLGSDLVNKVYTVVKTYNMTFTTLYIFFFGSSSLWCALSVLVLSALSHYPAVGLDSVGEVWMLYVGVMEHLTD